MNPNPAIPNPPHDTPDFAVFTPENADFAATRYTYARRHAHWARMVSEVINHMPRKTMKQTKPTERREHRTAAHDPKALAALTRALADAFVLIPVGAYRDGHRAPVMDRAGATVEHKPQPWSTAPPARPREAREVEPSFSRAFRRARYFAARAIDPEGLSPTRAKVYKAIRSAKDDGLTAKQIKSVCRLPHGSVQQTLNWLRSHRMVKAAESNLD